LGIGRRGRRVEVEIKIVAHFLVWFCALMAGAPPIWHPLCRCTVDINNMFNNNILYIYHVIASEWPYHPTIRMCSYCTNRAS
jgi:hypothetical protein